MTSTEIRALVQRIYDDVYIPQRADRVDDYYSNDCELTDSAIPDLCLGTEVIKQLIETYRSAMSDMEYEVIDMIVEDDRVAFEFRASGRHTGDGLGIPATNRRIETKGMVMATVRDGKIACVRQYWDRLSMYQQLGQVPPL